MRRLSFAAFRRRCHRCSCSAVAQQHMPPTQCAELQALALLCNLRSHKLESVCRAKDVRTALGPLWQCTSDWASSGAEQFAARHCHAASTAARKVSACIVHYHGNMASACRPRSSKEAKQPLLLQAEGCLPQQYRICGPLGQRAGASFAASLTQHPIGKQHVGCSSYMLALKPACRAWLAYGLAEIGQHRCTPVGQDLASWAHWKIQVGKRRKISSSAGSPASAG